MFQDVSTLKSGGHHQYPELNKRVGRLHSRWVQLRSALHSKLITRLASLSFPVVEERTVTRQTRTVLETRLVDTNHHFRALQEAIDWVKSKLVSYFEMELIPPLLLKHVYTHEFLFFNVNALIGLQINQNSFELNKTVSKIKLICFNLIFFFQKQLQEFEFSSDLSGAKIEMSHHQREHREIDRFQSTVDQCASAKVSLL